MPPRVTVLYRNSYRFTSESDIHKSQTLTLMCALYYNVRHELTVQTGLVFKDNRIVVPTSVRKEIIAMIHRSHHGIQGGIRRAKDAVYWPLINLQITDYVSQCIVCNTYRSE